MTSDTEMEFHNSHLPLPFSGHD